MAGYLRRLSPYRRVGGYISGGTASQPGSYPTTTSAVWSLDDLYLRRVGPLLDNYPNAAAAYSLRSLTSAYTGPVVTVRRSTDSAEADFTATEVSDGTLEAWCGAGDGLVKTLYDQSGHGRHASQSTATAQPKIVSGGVLVLENGLPAIDFDGTDDGLQTAAFASAIAQPVSAFVVTALDSADTRQIVFDNRSSSRFFIGRNNTTTYRMEADAAGLLYLAYGSATADQTIHSAIFNTTASSGFLNGVSGGSNSVGTNALDGLTIGNIRGTPSPITTGFALNGTLQELIIYPVDQSANRVAIEDNINSHYNVF